MKSQNTTVFAALLSLALLSGCELPTKVSRESDKAPDVTSSSSPSAVPSASPVVAEPAPAASASPSGIPLPIASAVPTSVPSPTPTATPTASACTPMLSTPEMFQEMTIDVSRIKVGNLGEQVVFVQAERTPNYIYTYRVLVGLGDQFRLVATLADSVTLRKSPGTGIVFNDSLFFPSSQTVNGILVSSLKKLDLVSGIETNIVDFQDRTIEKLFFDEVTNQFRGGFIISTNPNRNISWTYDPFGYYFTDGTSSGVRLLSNVEVPPMPNFPCGRSFALGCSWKSDPSRGFVLGMSGGSVGVLNDGEHAYTIGTHTEAGKVLFDLRRVDMRTNHSTEEFVTLGSSGNWEVLSVSNEKIVLIHEYFGGAHYLDFRYELVRVDWLSGSRTKVMDLPNLRSAPFMKRQADGKVSFFFPDGATGYANWNKGTVCEYQIP